MNEEQAPPRADGTANGGHGANPGPRREGSSGASDPQAQTMDDVERELDDLRSKAQTYLDLAQRTQADFVNYKRRIEQERSDFARSSRADVILKFLGPIDDLDRAMKAMPPEVRGSSWVKGIEIVERKFLQTLESLGVKRVEAVGKPFDPHEEEAVAHEPSREHAEGVVTNVVQSGYTIDGRVLRPAQVVVSSGQAEGSD